MCIIVILLLGVLFNHDASKCSGVDSLYQSVSIPISKLITVILGIEHPALIKGVEAAPLESNELTNLEG